MLGNRNAQSGEEQQNETPGASLRRRDQGPKQVAQGPIRIVAQAGGERGEEWAIEVAVKSKNGGTGGIRTSLPIDELLKAIQTVAAGRPWPPRPAQARDGKAPRIDARKGRRLTPCEQSVVRLAARGMRNAEIARELFVTEGTVKTHLHSSFRKLGLRNRAELTLHVVSSGLADAGKAA